MEAADPSERPRPTGEAGHQPLDVEQVERLNHRDSIGAEEVGAQFSIAASFVFPPFG